MEIHAIINLTPHEVRVIGAGDITLAVFPPDPGGPARCESRITPFFDIEIDGADPFYVVRSEMGEVTGLPEPVFRTLYIVSRVVAQACSERFDLIIPDDLVRDGAGRIVGCRRFASVGPFPGEYL